MKALNKILGSVGLVVALSLPVASVAEILAPVALDADHGYEAPAVEPSAWVVTYEMVDGERQRILTSINESPTRPGDLIFYELGIVNPTDEPLENVVLSNDFPGELLLQDGSLSGPEGMRVDYTVIGDEAEYVLIPTPENESEQPSLDMTETLRVTVPQVPANSRVLVTYAGLVRQGDQILTPSNSNEE